MLPTIFLFVLALSDELAFERIQLSDAFLC